MFRVKYNEGSGTLKTAKEYIWKNGYTKERMAIFETMDEAAVFAGHLLEMNPRILYCRIFEDKIPVQLPEGLIERRDGS